MAFRAANGLMAVLLLFAAALQYNDPDPALWIAVYAIGAVVCIAAMAGQVTARAAFAYAGGMLLLVVWVVMQRPGQPHMGWGPQGGILAEEVVREGLGVVIAAGWALFIGLVARRREREPAGDA